MCRVSLLNWRYLELSVGCSNKRNGGKLGKGTNDNIRKKCQNTADRGKCSAVEFKKFLKNRQINNIRETFRFIHLIHLIREEFDHI